MKDQAPSPAPEACPACGRIKPSPAQEGTREKVAAMLKAGLPQTEMALLLGISRQRVSAVVRSLQGPPTAPRGRPARGREAVLVLLRAQAEPQTAKQLRLRACEQGLSMTEAGIFYILAQLQAEGLAHEAGKVKTSKHRHSALWSPSGTGSDGKDTATQKSC